MSLFEKASLNFTFLSILARCSLRNYVPDSHLPFGLLACRCRMGKKSLIKSGNDSDGDIARNKNLHANEIALSLQGAKQR